MKRHFPRPCARALAALLLLSTAARAQTTPPPSPTLQIISATWKVADQPDVSVTTTVAKMVKDGQLELRVSAGNLGLARPPAGVTGQLVITYSINRGPPESKTIRGGNTLLKLGDPPVAAAQPADQKPPASPSLLQLTSQEPRDATNGSINGSLLVRELQRQAIAIAARDELGLRTRDMALGDPFAADAPGAVTTLLIGTQFRRAASTDTTLALPDGTPATDWKKFPALDMAKYIKASPDKLLATVHIAVPQKPWIDYAALVKDAEANSRNQFVAALKKSPALGKNAPYASPWVADGAVPPPVAAQLAVMNPFAQFAAINALHDQIRTDGNSTARLDALARGYANLAFMTNTLPSAAYKIYSARALLYAERLVAHNKADAPSLFTRAYVRGMTGLAALALDDLQAAQKKQTPTDAPPPWLPVIDAWCHYDLAKMQTLAQPAGPLQPLAEMLAVAIAADGYSTDQIIATGLACQEHQPNNLWVMQQLFKTDQLGLTATMPRLMFSAIPSALRSSAPLLNPPGDMAPAFAALPSGNEPQAAPLADLANSLDRASQLPDTNREPSLAALAALIRDEQFTAVLGGVRYLSRNLGAPKEDIAAYATATEPAWINHPFAGLVNVATIDGGADVKAYYDTFDSLHPTDAGAWLMGEFKAGLNFKKLTEKWPMVLIAEGHGDPLMSDQTPYTLSEVRLDKENFLKTLRDLSPHAATPYLAWVVTATPPANVDERAFIRQIIAEIQTRFPRRPRLIYFAAQVASSLNDVKQSIRLLEDLDRTDPSIETAEMLLQRYDLTGDMTRAKAVVDAAMMRPTPGLANAQISHTFAEMLKRRFRFADALPYDKGAAATYASWGLTGLASCQAALGATDDATALLEANAERYPDSPSLLRWYAWCLFKGRPELPKAAKALNDYIAQHPDAFYVAAEKMQLDGEPAKALAHLKANENLITNVQGGITYVIFAAEAGDAAQLDAAVKKVSAIKDKFMFQALVTAIAAIHGGADVRTALLPLEVQAGVPVCTHYMTLNWLARYLAATGHKPEALKFLQIALMQNGQSSHEFMTAARAVEKLGEDYVKLLNALRDHKVDLAPLVGTWDARQGTDAAQWTFDSDFTVHSSAGFYGSWWETDGRILVVWGGDTWAVLPWTPAADTLTGEGTPADMPFTMTRKK